MFARRNIREKGSLRETGAPYPRPPRFACGQAAKGVPAQSRQRRTTLRNSQQPITNKITLPSHTE